MSGKSQELLKMTLCGNPDLVSAKIFMKILRNITLDNCFKVLYSFLLPEIVRYYVECFNKSGNPLFEVSILVIIVSSFRY